jgi:hypothetical protein
MDWNEQTITVPRDRLDEPRIVSRITKCLSQSSDGGIEAILEVNKGVGTPQGRLKLLPCNNLAATLQQCEQDVIGLLLYF